jgi:outer membrane protein assembly factor BamB
VLAEQGLAPTLTMNTRRSLGLFGALHAALLLGGPLGAVETWARFRGEGGLGVAADQTVPTVLDEKAKAWSVPLPGPGSSSPVVWGEALFVTGEDRKKGEVTLVCLNAKSGKEQWSKKLHTGEYHVHNMNNFASASPAVSADVVVVSWFDAAKGLVMLSAYAHDGEKKWDYEVGEFKASHGLSMQPVIEGNQVVYCNLHQAGGSVAALDAKTGDQIWRKDYPENADKTTYATPLIRKVHGSEGMEVVVASMTLGVRGLDLKTGNENWALNGIFNQRTIVSPVDILAGSGARDSLLTVGCKNGTFIAVRPPDAKKSGAAEVAWRFGKKTPYVPTPVSDGETLYVLEDGGTLTAVAALTGEVKWKERLMANFYASPLLIGGKLYCLSREGEMHVAEVGDKLKVLSTADLKPGEEVDWADATPAVAHNSLYVRLGSRLDCYRAN